MTEDVKVGSYCYPVSAGSLKKGSYAILKGFPCIVESITISKTGKHGHAKAKIIGTHIFNGKKYDGIETTSHNIDVPNVDRVEYQLTDIRDGYVSLMDGEGKLREDLKVPEGELGEKIKELFEDGEDINIVVLSAMGHDQIMEYKIEKN